MQALAVSAPQDSLTVLTNDANGSYIGSVTLMKQLTVAIVSSVVYLKDVFPEDSYKVEMFRHLKLRILKMKCRDESAQFLSTALINAFDAFDKKYLQRLELCFYDAECRAENLVEYHVFEYEYCEEGASMRVRSRRDLGDDALALLQACTVLNNGYQKRLAPSSDISVRLHYNEAAPKDYQAPGFRCGVEFDEDFSQMDISSHLAGRVATRYHSLRVKSYFKDSLRTSNETIVSENPPQMTQTQDIPGTSSLAGYARSTRALRCPCNLDLPLPRDVTSLITCNLCKTQQHAVCFGLLRGGDGGGHCCADCADADPARSPTCHNLAKLTKKERKSLCTIRVLLARCRTCDLVSAASLSLLGLERADVLRLLQYLRIKQVLAHDHWDVPQPINQQLMLGVMAKLFSDVKQSDVVERLLEETFSSQESRPDPVADVLSPNEMASLRESTSVGRVGSQPSPADSDLLQQYRQALTPILGENPLPDSLVGMSLRRTKRKLEPDTTTLNSKLKAKRFRCVFD